MRETDYQWFIENYMDIFKKYGESYIVIKNKAILGVYKSFSEGVHSTEKNEQRGTFIVQYCNGLESGYTNYIASTNFM